MSTNTNPATTQTLHALADEYLEGLAILGDADVPAEVVFDTLEGMQGELTDKIDAVLAYAANLEAMANARKAEAERLTKSAKTLANKVENLHTYVQIALQRTGIKLPLVTRRFTVNLAKNPPASQIVNADLLPAFYKTETVTLSGSVGLAEKVHKILDANPEVLGLQSFDSEVKVDKKAVLSDLKTVAQANLAKPEGEAHDSIPGARLEPTSYRLTVR